MGTSRRGTKLQTQTWREWVPEARDLDERAQLTLDQVLNQLQRLGIKVTARALRDWQTQGVVPRPWTRTIAGEKRVTFPWWIVDLIVKLQAYLAAEGDKFTVPELPSRMRFEARLLAQSPSPDGWGGPPSDVSLIAERFAVNPLDAKLSDYIRAMAPPAGPLTSLGLTEGMDNELTATLKSVAKQVVEHLTQWGIATARVELHLTEKSGKVLTLPILSEEDTGKPTAEALPVG